MKKYMIIMVFMIYLLILYCFNQVLMPFLFAFLFYLMFKPIIDYFDSHALSISILAFIYLIIMLCVVLLIYLTYRKIIQYDIISLLLDIPYFNQFIDSIIYFISNMMASIPSLLLSFLVFILSTFFLVIDYKNIRQWITQSFPQQLIHLFVYYKDQCQNSMLHYFRCQLIIMMISFIHVLVVFYILKIPHAIFYSFGCALLDALPFIGIGVVLLPMSVYYLMNGFYLKSIYVMLIFIWLSFIRNILETRIMSTQMKIPSFLMFLSMMLHIHFFGLLGIILSPIHMNIICHMMLLDTP